MSAPKSSEKLVLAGAQLGGRGGGLPCPFLKIEKCALILRKKALIVSIFGLNIPFKMKFQEYLGEKTPKFSLRGIFSSVFNIFIELPQFLKNLPCPENFLVTRLFSHTTLMLFLFSIFASQMLTFELLSWLLPVKCFHSVADNLLQKR